MAPFRSRMFGTLLVRSVRRACWIVGASVLFAGSVTAQVPPEWADVAGEIEGALAAGEVPAFAVAVVENGRLAWSAGFGVTRPRGDQTVTAQTPFLLASVSKPITATALMTLVEQGLVDLDAPANRYLEPPGMRARRGDSDRITLRSLANHTSGLSTHWNFFPATGAAPPTMEETISRFGWAMEAPGDRWCYANLGFGVLQHVTERMGKKPWGDYVKERVFEPLGMSSAYTSWSEAEAAEAAAPCEGRSGGFEPLTPYGFDHPGASACWASADDLARFLLFHLGCDGEVQRPVLTLEARRAMRDVTGWQQPHGGTGVGWAVGDRKGEPTFGHSGGMPGVATLVQAFPDLKAGYVLLTNVPRRELINRVSQKLEARWIQDPKPSPLQRPAKNGAPAPHAPAAISVPSVFRGWIFHHDGPVRCTLRVTNPGEAQLSVGDGAPGALENLKVEGPVVSGRVRIPLPLHDDVATVPSFTLDLRLEGGRLRGVASGDLPGLCRVPYWVSLSDGLSGGELALVGGGTIPAGFREEVLRGREVVDRTVCILTHASNAEDAGGRAAELWREAGASEVSTVGPDDSLDALQNAVARAGVIWIGGGQQSRFMERIGDAGRLAILERLAAGATVGGTSAGAAVASDPMITGSGGSASDAPGVRLRSGLGLWPGVIVDQHFTERNRFNRLLLATRSRNLVGIGIDEGTGILVRAGHVTVWGEGQVTLIIPRPGGAELRFLSRGDEWDAVPRR